MRLSEEEIRQITLTAINELGDKANPETVKDVVSAAALKLSSTAAPSNKKGDATSGKIILTSFGMNHPGIVAKISASLCEAECDLQDISQKIMADFYTMIMIVDISNSKKELRDIQNEMNRIGEELKVKIYVQHEDVFRFMHRI